MKNSENNNLNYHSYSISSNQPQIVGREGEIEKDSIFNL